MSNAQKYVTAAYLVVLVVVLLYVVIYSFRMSRFSREVEELAELASGRAAEDRAAAGPELEPEQVG
ncbi:MAG: hypothetical protein U0R69_05345 [Gaiellales bacterium]